MMSTCSTDCSSDSSSSDSSSSSNSVSTLTTAVIPAPSLIEQLLQSSGRGLVQVHHNVPSVDAPVALFEWWKRNSDLTAVFRASTSYLWHENQQEALRTLFKAGWKTNPANKLLSIAGYVFSTRGDDLQQPSLVS